MAVLKSRNKDGTFSPISGSSNIIDWKNIINKPANAGKSELSTDVKVITLAPGNDASASLILNEETNQYELTLYIPRGADGVGSSDESGEGTTGSGADGYSPTITINKISGGHRITVVDVEGVESFDILDGVSAYKIASDNGYTGTEDEFNAFLGKLDEQNFVPSSDISNTIDESNTTEDSSTIPTTKAVADYIDSQKAETLKKDELLIPTSKAVADYIASEVIVLIASYLVDEESSKVSLDNDMYQIFENNISTKSMTLIVTGEGEESPLILTYLGNREFLGYNDDIFINITFPIDSNIGDISLKQYILSNSLTGSIDSTSNNNLVPTSKAVIDYVATQKSDTIDENSLLPPTPKAVIDYINANPDVMIISANREISDSGVYSVSLDDDNYTLFNQNLVDNKTMYLFIEDINLHLYYSGNREFTGFTGGTFIIVAFAENSPVGTYSAHSFLPYDRVSTSFDTPDKGSVPSLQAIIDYLPTQVVSEITDDESLPPTSQAVIDYVGSSAKVAIINATKVESEDSISLSIDANNYKIISDNLTSGKSLILLVEGSGLVLTHEGSGLFSGILDNNLVYASFSENILTSPLYSSGLLTEIRVKNESTSDDDTYYIPTLKVLKEYVETFGGVTINVATQEADGLLSKQDKKKLDGIAENANNYVHPDSHPMNFITGLLDALNNLTNNKLSITSVGVASGVASLDITGKVPKEQLPDVFTDNISEGYYNPTDELFYEDAEFTTPIEGVQGNYYVDKLSEMTYRYSGSIYVPQSSSAGIREMTEEEIDAIVNLRV